MNDIFHTKENENDEEKLEEKRFQVTPRKRKPQRTLGNIDKILDNLDTPQFSKKKNILKLRYENTENMKDKDELFSKKKNENKEENILNLATEKLEKEKVYQVTPRRRKNQRTFKNIDKILDNLDTPQFSKKKNILKSRFENVEGFDFK